MELKEAWNRNHNKVNKFFQKLSFTGLAQELVVVSTCDFKLGGHKFDLNPSNVPK